MDIQKAIEILSNFDMQVASERAYQSTIGEKACKYAIDALKELEQYRKIGTVDECRAAREKQSPKEPIMKPCDDLEDEYLCCPNCGKMLTDRIPFDPKTFYFHCLNCGQALKWGD